MPAGQPGDTLQFKALQTYDGGEVVRWIGPEDADEPAPTVTLEAAAAGGGHGAPRRRAAGGEAAAAAAAVHRGAAAAATTAARSLSIVALVVGALGLAAGIAGLLIARRTRPEPHEGAHDHPPHPRAALVAVAVSLALPAGASAHAGVKSDSPKAGGTASRSLGAVRVTFSDRVLDANLTVRTAAGRGRLDG